MPLDLADVVMLSVAAALAILGVILIRVWGTE